MLFQFSGQYLSHALSRISPEHVVNSVHFDHSEYVTIVLLLFHNTVITHHVMMLGGGISNKTDNVCNLA